MSQNYKYMAQLCYHILRCYVILVGMNVTRIKSDPIHPSRKAMMTTPTRAIGQGMCRVLRFGLPVLLTLALSQGPGRAKEIPVDGFESSLTWEADNPTDGVILTIVQTNVTEGAHALLVTFTNRGNEKVVIHQAANQDLTSISSLVLDAMNPQTKAVDVAIALQTGPKWAWFESRPVSLQPGINKNVHFDLIGKAFKSDRTEGLGAGLEYTDALTNLTQLQRTSILIYIGDADKLAVYLDNVRWEQPGSAATPTAPAISNPGEAVEKSAPLAPTAAPVEMLANGNFAAGLNNWVLEQSEGATGRMECVPEGPDGAAALRIQVLMIAPKAYHLQLYQTGPHIEKSRTYELTFWAKSDRDGGIKVNCMMNHEPWEHHTQELLPLSTEWKQLHFRFATPWSDNNVRISFTDLGATVGQTYWLAKCSLVPVSDSTTSHATAPGTAGPAAPGTPFVWKGDCSSEAAFVYSHHQTIPGHYEYLPDPQDPARGIVFMGHLTPDFKTADPEKFHLHPEIYFDHFVPGNITVSFDVKVDDLSPSELGPYGTNPWLNLVTLFDETTVAGGTLFHPSVMVNLVGSPGNYRLQAYSMDAHGAGTFYQKIAEGPVFPAGKWVTVRVETDVKTNQVHVYQDDALASAGPYLGKPGLAGAHMGLYANRKMTQATVFNSNINIRVGN